MEVTQDELDKIASDSYARGWEDGVREYKSIRSKASAASNKKNHEEYKQYQREYYHANKNDPEVKAKKSEYNRKYRNQNKINKSKVD